MPEFHKSYPIQSGYRGYAPSMDEYMLFSCEDDYKEWIRAQNEDAKGEN